jgi:tetratricopeptide (TPR) repeat protein
MARLWNSLRSSPAGQAVIVITLVIAAILAGTVLQSHSSESLLAERSLFKRLGGDDTAAGTRLASMSRQVDQATNPEARHAALVSRALAYEEMHRNDLALRDIDVAMSQPGVTSQLLGMDLFLRATLRLQVNDFAGAETDFTRLIAMKTEYDPAAHYDRGLARLKLGNGSGAKADFDVTISELPKYFAVQRTALSRTSFLTPSEQHRVLADAARNQARVLVMSHASRAIAYRELGQYQDAIADYDAALKIDPHTPSLYAERAYTELREGNWRAGLRDYWTRAKLALRLQ